jgi:hypothetical protein
MQNPLLYFVAQDIWEITVAIDATGEDGLLLRRIDRTAITLCDRLAEMGAARTSSERWAAALGSRRLCASIRRRLDVLRARMPGPRLERVSELLAELELAVAREIAAHAPN